MLKIGNLGIDEIVKEFGTPLYVYDEVNVLKQICDYKKYFASEKFDTEIIYASKALDIKYMYELANKAEIGIDVVSGGELYGAHIAGYDMKKAYFHGNNKSKEEIDMAIKYGVKTIVVDNILELKYLLQNVKVEFDVLIRINVGVSAHTHEYIVTSHPDSKFGIFIEDAEVDEAVQLLNKSENLHFKGFHSHIGSQIFDMQGFVIAIDKLFDLVKKYKAESLNLGGGIGIRYTDEDKPLSIKNACEILIEACEISMKKKDVTIKKVMIEPGRSIVGEAGYTLYTIGYQKVTRNKHYYFIDGGMTDNIRPALYHAKYSCDIASKLDNDKCIKATIAGKACESGDVIIKDVMLPKADKDDILVVYSTGAYGHSMASNYNQNLKLPIVFVNKDKAKLVVRRETYDDLYHLSVK